MPCHTHYYEFEWQGELHSSPTLADLVKHRRRVLADDRKAMELNTGRFVSFHELAPIFPVRRNV